jgi:SAM-dependent methyltransferase
MIREHDHLNLSFARLQNPEIQHDHGIPPVKHIEEAPGGRRCSVIVNIDEPDLTDAVRVVAAGYDALGARYGEWRGSVEANPVRPWLEEFERSIPAGRVVDLGCAAGEPATRFLIERGRDVTGVDVSEVQLALARVAFPHARFVRADMTAFDLAPGSVAGVVALFSMIHVPRERLGATLGHIRRWLLPGGAFLATFTARDNPGAIEDWLGTQMFFSGFAPVATIALLREAGFTIGRDEVISIREPEGDVSFHWVLART